MQTVLRQMIRSIGCRSNCVQKYPRLSLHGKLKTGNPYGDPKLSEHEVICGPFSSPPDAPSDDGMLTQGTSAPANLGTGESP